MTRVIQWDETVERDARVDEPKEENISWAGTGKYTKGKKVDCRLLLARVQLERVRPQNRRSTRKGEKREGRIHNSFIILIHRSTTILQVYTLHST